VAAFLIRPDLKLDLYVWWSTVTDSPVMWGTKKDFKKKFKKSRKWMFRFGEDFLERLNRTEQVGYSSRFLPWDEDRSLRWGGGTADGYCSVRMDVLPALLKVWETDLDMDMYDPRLLWLVDVEPHES
jgi:hypothetical protein